MSGRLPVRVRVTAAFGLAMAVLLVALSVFLVLRLASQLDTAIDAGLRSRATDLVSLTQSRPGSTLQHINTPLSDEDSSLAQVIAPTGQVVDRTTRAPAAPLLTRPQLQLAKGGGVIRDIRFGSEHDRIRLLAVPAGTGLPVGTAVIVGQSLEARDDAIVQLQNQLLLAVPVALLLACLVGYLSAGAALKPVAAMTSRARAIGAANLDARLPIPQADDEVRRLADTLNAMLDRLQATVEHERDFVANASHELRTPLAILSAEIQVALKTAESPGDYRTALVALGTETSRVIRLAEDLLVLARADQNELPLQQEIVDIAATINACVNRFSARAAESGVTLSAVADHDAFVHADAVRLEQLLDNVTENAIRHAAREVIISTTRSGSSVTVQVADDGPGLSSEIEGRAFERFVMADASRRGSHAGLGLAIVKAIADAHDWRVTLQNGHDQGAMFTLEMTVIEL